MLYLTILTILEARMPMKAAVIGLGNIGRYAIEALEIKPDFNCVGVVRRKESIGKEP